MTTIGASQVNWFATPGPEHLVQFYPHESELLTSLEEFIGTGLTNGETCIVIATERHIQQLDARLTLSKIDVSAAIAEGRYITLNAVTLLESFMVKGMPDQKRFLEVVEPMVAQATKRGKPARAFGEMVALLWKDGNRDAVIRLEDLWNKLARTHEFSLYCAYPELHFLTNLDMIDEIRGCHRLSIPSLSPSL
ncbi:MAG: domain S-box protein [Candidatus Saccharibacteria bacterium]|nr:domain S-box protein [Candidatus Saccharibacteria bacterium]